MDQLTRTEMDGCAGDPGFLVSQAANVDFDPPFGFVIEGDVLEPVDVEIAVELAIDALEQIEVELRRHPGPIVVGGIEDLRVLFQIDADQHLAAVSENARVIGQKVYCGVRLEIADRRAWKEADPLAIRAGQGRQREGPRVIGADRDDRQPWEVLGEAAGSVPQMLARDVDRHVSRRPIERLQQDARFGARAAAELNQPAVRADLCRDLRRIRFEDRDLGAGRVILRQAADRLE